MCLLMVFYFAQKRPGRHLFWQSVLSSLTWAIPKLQPEAHKSGKSATQAIVSFTSSYPAIKSARSTVHPLLRLLKYIWDLSFGRIRSQPDLPSEYPLLSPRAYWPTIPRQIHEETWSPCRSANNACKGKGHGAERCWFARCHAGKWYEVLWSGRDASWRMQNMQFVDY